MSQPYCFALGEEESFPAPSLVGRTSACVVLAQRKKKCSLSDSLSLFLLHPSISISLSLSFFFFSSSFSSLLLFASFLFFVSSFLLIFLPEPIGCSEFVLVLVPLLNPVVPSIHPSFLPSLPFPRSPSLSFSLLLSLFSLSSPVTTFCLSSLSPLSPPTGFDLRFRVFQSRLLIVRLVSCAPWEGPKNIIKKKKKRQKKRKNKKDSLPHTQNTSFLPNFPPIVNSSILSCRFSVDSPSVGGFVIMAPPARLRILSGLFFPPYQSR